jgi:hypothetical protein
MGHIMALSLLEVVDDAIGELEAMRLPKDAASVYQELKLMEDQDYGVFAASEPSATHDYMIKEVQDQLGDLDILSAFYKTRAYCHTARLPAEARYAGIVTETDQVGFLHYDTGINREAAQRDPNNSSNMRLAYEPWERQRCNVTLQADFKDFFFVGEPEGAKSLTLPNDAELRAYGTGKPILGLIGMAPAICDWSCNPENVAPSELDTGEWEVSVNGVPVTGHAMLAGTFFVRHKDGWYFPPNEDGRFAIQVRVTAVGKYARISSFIIY